MSIGDFLNNVGMGMAMGATYGLMSQMGGGMFGGGFGIFGGGYMPMFGGGMFECYYPHHHHHHCHSWWC